jgi:hypothetical protein
MQVHLVLGYTLSKLILSHIGKIQHVLLLHLPLEASIQGDVCCLELPNTSSWNVLEGELLPAACTVA